jgi:hypothetical protein
VAYTDLVFLVGAYDRDGADILTVISQPPVNGKLSLGKSDQAKPTLPKTCSNQKVRTHVFFAKFSMSVEGFIQWGRCGIYPRHEFDIGDIRPHQLEFFNNFFLVLKI